MSFYKKFKTDENMEAGDGITLDYGDSGKIVIHRAGGANRKYARVLEARMKPYRFQIQQGVMDDKVAERLLAEVYAESVVIRLIDCPGPDGEIMESTKENVVKLFTDMPDVFRDVQQQANQVANFRAAEREEDAKNSEASSAGN